MRLHDIAQELVNRYALDTNRALVRPNPLSRECYDRVESGETTEYEAKQLLLARERQNLREERKAAERARKLDRRRRRGQSRD